MAEAQSGFQEASSRESTISLDAVVIGAGFSGLYMLYRLRDKLGLSVRVYEAGDGVGGTWYWNRYPGARCDSDSYIYCYTFDKQLLQEWEWSERYSEQPEILRYLNHVAERFDLRRDIQFGTRVTEASFNEQTSCWEIRTDQGDFVSTRYLITAVGNLSIANLPKFKGLESFAGKCHHTSQWPQGGVDFTAKRVAVVGTGATAVQAIPEIAQQAKQLTVFQRTPSFCVPARNGKVDPELVKERKANYDRIVERIKNSFFGFELDFINKSALEASAEEREREFDARWDVGGFAFWLANYQDMFFNKEANDVCAEYLKRKIRATINDPAIAEKLIPSYAYGTKRQPLDTNYYETFNRKNVLLLDARDAPIEEITPRGIRAGGKEYGFDIIVLATGFDAMTGPLASIKIQGRNGQQLSKKWEGGPRTYLGIAIAGFPNLFTITGPGSPSVLTNMPVSIQQHVEWIADCLDYLRRNQLAIIEATPEAEDGWTAHVGEVANASLMPGTNSWYRGANIPGKTRVFMPYIGGFATYRQKCHEIAERGYKGFASTTAR